MRSRQLEAALTEFVEEAARYLQTDVDCGSEIQFEVEQRGSSAARTPLYCYRPLTREFMGQRWRALSGLSSHARAKSALETLDGLDRYLGDRGAPDGPADAHAQAGAALWTLLDDVFGEQSDFSPRQERVREAIERIEGAVLAGSVESTVVATLHGMAITSQELPIRGGLSIARPGTADGMPEGTAPISATDTVDHLLVAFTSDQPDRAAAEADGGRVLGDLLLALRLFGDARVSFGRLAWVRSGSGRWRPFALGGDGRPHGMLVVAPAQEDELRAFCNLVSRRAPRRNALAWALARFQMGCERADELEALSDYLLALRALLEPAGSPRGVLPGRLAALCAPPEQRAELQALTLHAIELEQVAIDGSVPPAAAARELVRTLADHLRALMRDVLCGHLEGDLPALADRLLQSGPVRTAPVGAHDDDALAGLAGPLLGGVAGELGSATPGAAVGPGGVEPALAGEAAEWERIAGPGSARVPIRLDRLAAGGRSTAPAGGDRADDDGEDPGDEQLRFVGMPG